MNDIQGELVSIIDALDGVAAWRNRLPVGFDNTSAACYVRIQNDVLHQTGATRNVSVIVRVYGGSAKTSDLRAAMDMIIEALIMKNTSTIAVIGDISRDELPPEPETGWLSANIRFNCRIKET